jgi:uncharacterized protein Yka (UPF0111/DUF47 family)
MPLLRPKPDPELLGLFEESARNVQRVSLLLRDLLADYPENAGLARDILLCEQEGDRIAHDILHRLAGNGHRRTAFDAADVHGLAGALDDIVDYAEEAADQLALYGVEAPMEQAEAIAALLVECAEQVAAAMRGLRAGAELLPHLVEIHRLENEGDRLVRAAVASLFADGIDPMMLIRWKDIFETLEEAVDACETVANVLEGRQPATSHPASRMRGSPPSASTARGARPRHANTMATTHAAADSTIAGVTPGGRSQSPAESPAMGTLKMISANPLSASTTICGTAVDQRMRRTGRTVIR